MKNEIKRRKQKKAIIRISVFYVIGISLSNIFRFDLFHIRESTDTLYFTSLLFVPLGAIGVLLGALISLNLLKKERITQYSLFGTSKKWSLIMISVPIILLAVTGVDNSNNENIHYYGLMAGIGSLLFYICEEFGWRGYLQDELKTLKEWQRVLLIGFLWYLWHLEFIHNQNILSNMEFFGWMVLGSWGIGKVIDSTKSILAATSFHMIISSVMFNGLIQNGINENQKLIIIGVSFVICFIVIKKWEKENKTIANNGYN